MSNTILRHAGIEDMVAVLNSERAHTADVVIPGRNLAYRDGLITVGDHPLIKLDEPIVTEDGVTSQINPNGTYRPTQHGDATMASALEIPTSYVRKLRDSGRTDLLDQNVRGLLRGKTVKRASGDEVVHPADSRSFLLRLLTSEDRTQTGVLRAFLSDRFAMVDNLDVLTATLAGISQVQIDGQPLTVEVRDCDLTDTRMHVRMFAPQVSALAPVMLEGYSNPWENGQLRGQLERSVSDLQAWRRAAAAEGMGFEAGKEPIVFAGLTLDNSEVGAGAFRLAFQIVVKVCKNGLTLPIQLRKIHLGGQLDEGNQWNSEVQRKQLGVLTSQVKQKVGEWFKPEFLAAEVGKLEAAAGAPVADAEATVKAVATRYKFTEAERAGVLAHFMIGGQTTAAGVANAITSYSQTVDPDRAEVLDSIAVSAMTMVK